MVTKATWLRNRFAPGQSWRNLASLILTVPALTLTVSPVASRTPAQPSPHMAALQQDIATLAALTHGRVGIAARDLDGDDEILINGDQPFPMASTAKVAVAATFLQQVEHGRYRLDQPFPMMMPVARRRSLVAEVRAGPAYSAQELIERMITRSDNHATDGLIAAVGGVATVNRFLAEAGIIGQHLDTTMARLVAEDGRADPGNVSASGTVSTPRAMVALLAAIDRGGALSPQARAVLLDTMTRTSTGRNRIRAGLPEGILLAHKTGTLHGVTDDVGIVRMPNGHHVAIAIFTAGGDAHGTQAALIARIARTVFDGFNQPMVESTLVPANR